MKVQKQQNTNETESLSDLDQVRDHARFSKLHTYRSGPNLGSR